MSIDSIGLAALRKELLEVFSQGEIVNIFQVKKYKIILEVKPLRTSSLSNNTTPLTENRKLFHLHLSLDPSEMEIYFSEAENIPKTITSPFLTLLQKQLIGGKILAIEHPDFDRILHFILQPYLKFGQSKKLILIAEFMGKHSNLILINENKIIEGSIKLVTSRINRFREVSPGELYLPPPSSSLNPLKIDQENFLNLFSSSTSKDKDLNLYPLLQHHLKGLNPQSIREIIFQANLLPEKKIGEILPEELESLWASFHKIMEDIKQQNFNPTIFLDPISKKISSYSLIESVQFSQESKLKFADANSCLKYFFREKQKEREVLFLTREIENTLHKNIVKIKEKIEGYQEQIEEAKNSEEYKIRGELIKSNLGRLKKGDLEFTAINYYSPQQEEITIPLDSSLTPLQNAQLYFKKYRKAKDSLKIITERLKSNQLKLARLEELERLSRQDNTLPHLQNIYQNLVKLGLIKETTVPGKKQKKEDNKLRPLKYISKDGWEIYVGKNNQQNDFLTLKLASGNDLWLHTKNTPGAHVIIKNKGDNQTPPLDTLLQAAQLAAYFSKTKKEDKVVVDYTLKKYVKKPKKAKPGMVIYSQEKSLLIKVDPEEIKDLIPSK